MTTFLTLLSKGPISFQENAYKLALLFNAPKSSKKGLSGYDKTISNTSKK